MPTNRMRPIHPGEILHEEFLKPRVEELDKEHAAERRGIRRLRTA